MISQLPGFIAGHLYTAPPLWIPGWLESALGAPTNNLVYYTYLYTAPSLWIPG